MGPPREVRGDLNQWIHGPFGRSSILVLSGTRLAFAIPDEKSKLIWPWVSKSGFTALRFVNYGEFAVAIAIFVCSEGSIGDEV